jgi:hypothetical protein
LWLQEKVGVTNHAYEVQLFKAKLILTQTNFKTKELYKAVKILFGHYKQQDFMHISVATGAGRCDEPCLQGLTHQA